MPYHQATEQRLSLGCESPQFWFAYVNCVNLYYKALVRVDPLSSEKYNIYIYKTSKKWLETRDIGLSY